MTSLQPELRRAASAARVAGRATVRSAAGISSNRPKARHAGRVAPRPSTMLRDLLTKNPGVETFTIQGIVDSIDCDPAAALMVFSIPALVPVPGTADLVGIPTLALSSVLVGRRRKVRLPTAILQRSVPRRALALAIHAALPVLDRLERVTKRRWSWLCTPAARRLVGVLVFLLALPLAFPILGFGVAHAASLFTIALGMMENDGAAIALGMTAGIASLVFFTAKGLSPKALALKAITYTKRLVTQITSIGAVAAAIIRRLRRWFMVTLLSGPQAKGRVALRGASPLPRRLSASPQAALRMSFAHAPLPVALA